MGILANPSSVQFPQKDLPTGDFPYYEKFSPPSKSPQQIIHPSLHTQKMYECFTKTNTIRKQRTNFIT